MLRERGPWQDGDAVLDQDLQPLAAELDAAGARARAGSHAAGRSGADPVFAAALRARLMDALPASAGTATSRLDVLPDAAVAVVPEVPVRLAPRMTRLDDGSVVRRWGLLAVAAALIVAVVGLEAGPLLRGRPAARTSDAVGATLVRAGVQRQLLAGAQLEAGDVVRVTEPGHALLDLADGQARLAGGAVVELLAVASDHVELDQLAGRVYHRVRMAPGGTYLVRTGAVTWTAWGTAFDLDRRGPTGGEAGETVRALGIQHDIRVDGAGLAATVAEGRSAIVHLAGDVADLELRGLTAADMADAWLLANVRRDQEAGLPLGALSGLAEVLATIAPPSAASTIPSVTPVPATPTPEAESPATAAPTPSSPPVKPPSPSPTVKPTATPKPSPTPTPVPTPTPAPTIGTLSLALTPCEGAFVIASWSKWLGTGFDHYQGLRGLSSTIPAVDPPADGVTAPAGLYSGVQTTISGLDTGLAAGSTYWYRAVAFDATNQALAASGSLSAVAKPAKALGALSISSSGPTSTTFGWTPYGGAAACFTYYKLVYSASDPSPSYLKGSPYVWVGSTKSDTGVTVDGIAPGTYWFKLEALRSTATGHIVLAATDVASYTVP